MSLPQLTACIALGLAASCSLPTMDVVSDLAAIHNPRTWQPQSPAQLSVPPNFYFGNVAARVSGDDSYVIEDHRALELAILDQINGVDATDPPYAIEVSSWMLIELSQDDYSEARVAATHVLLRLAGTWAERDQVTWMATQDGADFQQAVHALNAATDHTSFMVGVEALRRTQIPDLISGIRVLTALGRLSHKYGLSAGGGNEIVLSAALGVVIQCLEEIDGDADPKVADALKVSLDFLRNKAQRS
jgi:hypothetical protein